MSKASDLLIAYENLDWETYIVLSESLTKIDPRSVEEELTNQPKLFSYYAGLFETSKKDVEKTEIDLTQAVARAKMSAATALKSTGVRPTAALLETHAETDDDVVALTEELNKLKYKSGLLKSLMQALTHKKDCLVQISANQRAEKGLYH